MRKRKMDELAEERRDMDVEPPQTPYSVTQDFHGRTVKHDLEDGEEGDRDMPILPEPKRQRMMSDANDDGERRNQDPPGNMAPESESSSGHSAVGKGVSNLVLVDGDDVEDVEHPAANANSLSSFHTANVSNNPSRVQTPEHEEPENKPEEASTLMIGPSFEMESARILLRNLPHVVTAEELAEWAKQAAPVWYADCHRYSPGEGVVEFQYVKNVDTALETLPGLKLKENIVRVQRF
ncbi:hypothetical protein BT69DRAFT_985090 [Atractiella rhizophila]|nr:hypothetical protein BT69DRAFT_985090 [Atractiella rhizophila]